MKTPEQLKGAIRNMAKAKNLRRNYIAGDPSQQT